MNGVQHSTEQKIWFNQYLIQLDIVSNDYLCVLSTELINNATLHNLNGSF